MGVYKFFELFEADRIINVKNLFKYKIAVDAYSEMYRACTGMRIMGLTNKEGRPTIHISPLRASIMHLYNANVAQIWVFDPSKASIQKAKNEGYINNDKSEELNRRKKVKDVATEKMKDLEDGEELDKLAKQAFTLPDYVIEDLITMLDILGIPWVESPVGVEGEAYASKLAALGIVDGVYSMDSDPIPFGSPKLFRYVPKCKKIYEYDLSSIINSIDEDADIYDLRKICAILGNDFCIKTKGISTKTVIKKYKKVILNEDQIKSIEIYSRNIEIEEFELEFKEISQDRVDTLINWLVDQYDFNRDRLVNSFNKDLKIMTKPCKT